MNQFTTLLKREFWEHRSMFLFIPMGISGFLVLLMALSLFVLNMEVSDDAAVTVTINGDHYLSRGGSQGEAESRGPIREIAIAKLRKLAESDLETREQQLNKFLLILSAPIRAVLMFVIFFYLLGSLYEERKNQTILFWKSMPVSDFATVVSKLVSALVVAPLIVLACIALTDICALSLATILAVIAEIDIGSVVWSPANLLSHWALLVVIFVLQVIWLWPAFGWLVLVSAFARSIPLMWVFGVPIALLMAAEMLFSFDWFGAFLMAHMNPLGTLSSHQYSMETRHLFDLFSDMDMWLGLLIGCLFLYAAVWKRAGGDQA